MRLKPKTVVPLMALLLCAGGVGYAKGRQVAWWLAPASISRLQWLAVELNATYREDCPSLMGKHEYCVSYFFIPLENQQAIQIYLQTYGDVPLDFYESKVDTARKVFESTAKSEFDREPTLKVVRAGKTEAN